MIEETTKVQSIEEMQEITIKNHPAIHCIVGKNKEQLTERKGFVELFLDLSKKKKFFKSQSEKRANVHYFTVELELINAELMKIEASELQDLRDSHLVIIKENNCVSLGFDCNGNYIVKNLNEKFFHKFSTPRPAIERFYELVEINK